MRRARALARETEARPPTRAGDALALLIVLGVTWAALGGVVGNAFLNWDDRAALVDNAALDAPNVLGWAFATTHMSHYQPLAWLAWSLARRSFGATPAVHHALSLALHLVNAGLVFMLAMRLGALAGLASVSRRVSAVAAASFFAIHPLRVEPVAWASGFPYVLALAPLLLSVLLYLRHCAGSGSRAALLASLFCYGASVLCRAFSPALPVALLLLDFALGRLRTVGWRTALIEKIPFAAVGGAAMLAEGGARHFASLERVGVSERASEAALAPFVYLFRTLWPVGLSPLDALSLEHRVAVPALAVGVGLLAAVTALAYRARHERPWLLAAWLSYLLLLGPALGLLPSGLQATADRYTYLPSVAVALLAGAGATRLWEDARRRWLKVALGVGLAVWLVGVTRHQVAYWRDSVTLWTRALELDAKNDVALYNLAHALAERGDAAAAEAHYRRLLELVPEHEIGRRNLALLEAARFEREGNESAAAGRLAEAVELYTRALDRDAARLHSLRSRGMALAQLGRYVEAIPDLGRAAQAPDAEPAVAGALAYALDEMGRRDEARTVLRAALVRHPGDRQLAEGLAALEPRPK